jgi:hypothetical protein
MSANDTDTKLLLHCNGADEHTTFTDNSVGGNGGSQHTVSVVGNAQGDTAQKRFGTASLLLDGSGDYLTVPDHADWSFGSSAFTIDFVVRYNAIPTTSPSADVLMGKYQDASNYWVLRLYYGGGQYKYEFRQISGGSLDINVTLDATDPTLNTWYHIALIRGWAGNVNDYAITVDGVALGTETDSTAVADITGNLEIGGASQYNDVNGWMDEIRIVKGVARWTANFESPSGPYPDTNDVWMGVVNGVENPAQVNGVTAANLFAAGTVSGVATYQ